ncbi:LysE family transporter [Pendulispora rubella]|uniref:LysE family transporter n=1 Tax=Pendulispora rubella TaxID=2741070 RepID=A0ABZ2L5D6_9BACT
MNYASLLLTLFAVDMLAVISPGPNFVVVMETAVVHRTRAALAAVVGVAAGDLVWSLVALLGLSAVFTLWPWLYGAMKLVGGAYLIYLGVMAWRSRSEAPLGAAPVRKDAPPRSLAVSFFRGFVTTLTNPKSVAYWGSIFTLFLKPGMPLWVEASAISIGVFDALLWYGAVALLFSSAPVRAFYTRVERWIHRVTGAVMIAFGARMVLDKD